jgi:hypothetical protein
MDASGPLLDASVSLLKAATVDELAVLEGLGAQDLCLCLADRLPHSARYLPVSIVPHHRHALGADPVLFGVGPEVPVGFCPLLRGELGNLVHGTSAGIQSILWRQRVLGRSGLLDSLGELWDLSDLSITRAGIGRDLKLVFRATVFDLGGIQLVKLVTSVPDRLCGSPKSSAKALLIAQEGRAHVEQGSAEIFLGERVVASDGLGRSRNRLLEVLRRLGGQGLVVLAREHLQELVVRVAIAPLALLGNRGELF